MSEKSKTHLRIGQIASRTGLSVSAIRFYDDKGLIHSIRDAGGKRIFKRSTLRRVSFIMVSQELGYTLKEIASALKKLPESRTPNKKDWERLAKHFQKDLDERIQALELLKSKLASCIGCGCLSLKVCNLYNKGDKASLEGAGPRYLLEHSS